MLILHSKNLAQTNFKQRINACYLGNFIQIDLRNNSITKGGRERETEKEKKKEKEKKSAIFKFPNI